MDAAGLPIVKPTLITLGSKKISDEEFAPFYAHQMFREVVPFTADEKVRR